MKESFGIIQRTSFHEVLIWKDFNYKDVYSAEDVRRMNLQERTDSAYIQTSCELHFMKY